MKQSELNAYAALAAANLVIASRRIVNIVPRYEIFPDSLQPKPRPDGAATPEQKAATLAGRRGKLPRSKRKKRS